MANQTEGNGRTGRSVALPDENRPSWRPQDEAHRTRRPIADDDDRYEDERFMRGRWDERDRHDWDRETDYRGQGQSGYSAGRHQDDRSMGYQQRNQGYPGSFDDRYRERGTDDRFTGRGGAPYGDRGYQPERSGAQGGYGGGRGYEADKPGMPRGYGYHDGDRPNLGTGGAMYREGTGHGGTREIQGGQPSQSWNPYGSQGSRGGGAVGGHRGKGPSNFQRSDERIREMVCEALTDDDRVDASNIEVTVKAGEVTLGGTVEDRHMKRCAEDVAEVISGVKEVQNQIRVAGDKRSSGMEHENNDRSPSKQRPS